MSHDVIKGTPKNDILQGTNGDDVIQARAGADIVFALGGNDDIYGEEGPDALTGGNGTDTFHFKAGDGIDFVNDLHVKSQDDSVVLHGVEEDDIDTVFLEASNTTILRIDPDVGGGTITFFGESETDVLSAISFQPLDDYLV
jgi:Ca2+-binding RTX toxin-like protein